MKKETVIVPKQFHYLSEYIDKLPSRCLLNKGITGCGGTTLELTCKRNSIILVPTVSLVKSKQRDGLMCVYQNVTIEDIKNYILSDIQYKKIIGTYDSLNKIMSAIPEYSNYFLLIDEYHLLFNDYSFRTEAILNVLEKFRMFHDWCFMTATPLNDTFILQELKDIDQITYVWECAEKVNIHIKDTAYIQREIIDVMTSYPNRNLHIFLNSVLTIKKIVKKLGTDDFRVVCSLNQTQTIKHKTDITSPIRKFNFYTSCSFEGCDIDDENGMTVILCDTALSTTVLDISTKIRQICGRLRNSKYKNECIIILNTKKHRYIGVSPVEFDLVSKAAEKKGRIREGLILRETPEEYSTEIDLYRTSKIGYINMYLNMFDGKIFYDPNLKSIDLYNYNLIAEIYNDTLSVINEYKDKDFNVVSLKETKHRYDTGINWIFQIIKDSNKYEWTYGELENKFKPLFKQYGMSWDPKNIFRLFFPKYIKTRKWIGGKGIVIYKFAINAPIHSLERFMD